MTQAGLGDKREREEAPAEDGAKRAKPAGALDVAMAYSEDRGARMFLEDVCVILQRAEPEDLPSCSTRCAFAAVFDGHGGVEVARLAADVLHTHTLRAGLAKVLEDASAQPDSRVDAKAAKAAVIQGFQSADKEVLDRCAKDSWSSGACAVVAWLLGNILVLGNVGDSKGVLARITDKDVGSVKAGQLRGIQLSKDHLAVTERQRISKAGGWVSGDGRLGGKMQVSRSFGDAALKKEGCICTPDVTAFAVTGRDRFLLLACDGFWTVFDAQSAVDTTAKLLSEGLEPKAVTNRLINIAIRERKCTDNCSVLLMVFQGVDHAELQQKQGQT